MKFITAALAAALALCPSSAAGPTALPKGITLIEGYYGDAHQPNGNTVIFEDARDLIVVDTGRYPDHQENILAAARRIGKPIRAIVNTHWHLDHSGGNAELRAVYPKAHLYTSMSIRGALDGFLAGGLVRAKARYADPKSTPSQRASAKLAIDTVEDRANLIPDRPVNGPMTIPYRQAGLRLTLHRNAATTGDTTVYDPATRTFVAGDLVVIPAPFFDTACADGWRRALDRIAAVPFVRLIPGHGPVMTRAQFGTYRSAFNRLVDCMEGKADPKTCTAGWIRDMGTMLTDVQREQAGELIEDYTVETIRAAGSQTALCKPDF